MKRVIKNIYKKYLGNKISKSILSLALPIIIQNILFTLMGFADQVMVGQLGETVISAIGNAAQLSLFLFLLFSAIGQGGAILISQYYGAKETDKLKKTLSSIIFIGFFIGIAFFLITYFFGNTMIFYILTLARF